MLLLKGENRSFGLSWYYRCIPIVSNCAGPNPLWGAYLTIICNLAVIHLPCFVIISRFLFLIVDDPMDKYANTLSHSHAF